MVNPKDVHARMITELGTFRAIGAKIGQSSLLQAVM
jgi:hypothetical protein